MPSIFEQTQPTALSAASMRLPNNRDRDVRSSAPAPVNLSLAVRFGQRLKELRHKKGMTQLEIAIEFGIDRTFLSDLERGRKSVSLPFIEIFALGYGLSISELLDQL